MKTSMYETKCAYCGKVLYTFATDKLGNIPTVYCSKTCEGQVKNESRFK